MGFWLLDDISNIAVAAAVIHSDLALWPLNPF